MNGYDDNSDNQKKIERERNKISDPALKKSLCQRPAGKHEKCISF